LHDKKIGLLSSSKVKNILPKEYISEIIIKKAALRQPFLSDFSSFLVKVK